MIFNNAEHISEAHSLQCFNIILDSDQIQRLHETFIQRNSQFLNGENVVLVSMTTMKS